MKQSESINELAEALAKAQHEFAPVTKDATNPFFKSSYATLGSILEVLNPVLHKHGLSFTQLTDVDEDGKIFLDTQITHKSGQWMRGRYPIVSKDMSDPQKLGSAQTYARRYALQAAFGLSAEDDDAHSASQKPQKKSNDYEPPEKPSLISEAQRKRLWAIANKEGLTEDSLKILLKSFGYNSTKDIKWVDYDKVIKVIEGGQNETPKGTNR